MKTKILLLLVLVSFLVNPFKGKAQTANVQDSLALVDLYDSTSGRNWNNWTGTWLSGPVATWPGVSLDANGRVISITLSSNNLTGSMPYTLGNLTKLQSLDLNGNWITGNIPSSLGSLVNLTKLDLSYNQLKGGIPVSIGNLVNLQTLNLNTNQLGDTIPSSLVNLVNLQTLNLSFDYYLTGTIPTAIGNLKQLIYLKLDDNKLSGSLPSSLGTLKNLTTCDLNNNQITGSIPATLGGLTMLRELKLNNNQLTGAIPSTFAKLTNLVVLGLGGNNLGGTIPTWLSSLDVLQTLDLGTNQFTGAIPDTLRNITTLVSLYLNNNKLTGGVPAWLGTMPALENLGLADNKLAGDLPFTLGNHGAWTSLSLQDNYFTFKGMELIAEINNYNYAVTLSPQYTILPLIFSNYQFSVTAAGGTQNTYKWYRNNVLVRTTNGDSTYLPNEVGKYSVSVTDYDPNVTLYSDSISITASQLSPGFKADSLALVDLYNSTNGARWLNNTGWLTTAPLSTWFGVGTDIDGRVVSIDLHWDSLRGYIPSSIGNISNLSNLSLYVNKLTGTIPASLGNLTQLQKLELFTNQLTGPIPSSIGNLTQLQQLVLSYNNLTGAIPPNIGNLKQLNYINLSANQLTDSIPSGLGSLSLLTDIDMYQNNFSGSLPSTFANLPILQRLDLHANQLTGSIPASFNHISASELDLQNNHLSGNMPDSFLYLGLSPYAFSNGLNFSNNYFTFNGSELAKKFFNWRANFTSQDTILPLHYTNNTFFVSAGGTLANDTFRLYRNDTLLKTQIGDSAFAFQDTVGKYHIKVSNAIENEFFLTSDTLNITKIPVYPIANKNDSLALVALYNSTNGPRWFNNGGWLNGPVASWYGITLVNGRVNNITLSSNGLIGHLTDSLGNLTSLDTLLLNNNQIGDSVPNSLSNLPALKALDLSNNKLSFSSVENIAKKYSFAKYSPQANILLTQNSTILSVSSGGTLANETFRLYKSGILYSTKTGDSTFTITEAGKYNIAITNSVAANLTLFTDTVTIMSNLTDSLALVDFYNNNGPNSSLRQPMLKWLSSAPIGQWWGVTTDSTGRVIYLDLSGELLYCQLPTSIGNLSNLRTLELEGTLLEGSIPSTIGNLSKLQELYLQNNQLIGEIPESLGRLSSLFDFYLMGNKLTGNIPDIFSNFPVLKELDLHNNQLSGSIPPSICKLTSLGVLNLSYNLLSGGIPAAIDTLDNIFNADFSNNYLTFDGMEFIALRYGTSAYVPQFTTLPLHFNLNKLSVYAGGTLSNNTYNWYRNGNLVAETIGDSTYPITIGGTYAVAVTNSKAIELTLYSNMLTIGDGTDSLILPARPNTEYASYEYTDTAGWTHYYYDNNTPNDLTDDTLLLSLKKNGQDIGTIGDGTFAVKLVATAGAGSNTGTHLTSPLITNTSGYWVMNRYWQVTPTHEPTANVGVRFYYNNQDLKDVNGSYPTHNLTNNKLIFYKAVGGNPDPTTNLAGATRIISILPGTVASDTSWTYHALSDTTQYGEYSVASFSGGGGGGTGNNEALPVVLINFTASLLKNDAQLNWQTSQEVNAGSYTVERRLTGTGFTAIGTVEAAGNSTIVQSYRLTDYNAALLNTTALYYRIKITDKDGNFTYSKIIKIDIGGVNNAFVVYPNPAQNTANIAFTATAAGKYAIEITDIAGKALKRIEGASAVGANTITVNVVNYAQGTYIVKIEGDYVSKQSLKLVKQ